ncbi:MAG: hypothetical protein K2G67_01530 [Muribaculaceae bacterium]|nr:hypothetical protein [Muribaculaceae bacterium]
MSAAGAMLLAGCSAELTDGPDNPVKAPDDAPFYLTFELAAPTASANSQAHAPATRAGETRAEVVKREDESTINSIIAYMVDAEGAYANRIAGVAYGDNVVIGTYDTGAKTTTVTLNMGLNTLYSRKHKYRVYVLANVPETSDFTSGAIGTDISNISRTVVQFNSGVFAATPTILPTELDSRGIPLSTAPADAAKIQVWLEENADYSDADNAYVVKADTGKKDADGNPNSKETSGTLTLTPLYARFDFVRADSKSDFVYSIDYKEGDGSETSSTEVMVEFKQARVVGAAKEVYTVLRSGSQAQVAAGQTFISPLTALTTSTSGISGNIAIKHSEAGSTVEGKDNPAIYVPEYIPVLGSATMLNYNKVTYLELDAILKVDNSCTASATVKSLIGGSDKTKALAYYDDGKYQSVLMPFDATKMTDVYDATTNPNGKWRKLTWDATLGGYKVTYRHAIRNSSGPSEEWKDDDGVVYPMEYGVVRNSLYQIGIASVSALPHPWTTTTPVESDKKDINIKILPPTKWFYHRGGFELNFE